MTGTPDPRVAAILAGEKAIKDRDAAKAKADEDAAAARVKRAEEALRFANDFEPKLKNAVSETSRDLLPAGLTVRLIDGRRPISDGPSILFHHTIGVSRSVNNIATLSLTVTSDGSVRTVSTYFNHQGFSDNLPIEGFGEKQIRDRLLRCVTEAQKLS